MAAPSPSLVSSLRWFQGRGCCCSSPKAHSDDRKLMFLSSRLARGWMCWSWLRMVEAVVFRLELVKMVMISSSLDCLLLSLSLDFLGQNRNTARGSLSLHLSPAQSEEFSLSCSRRWSRGGEWRWSGVFVVEADVVEWFAVVEVECVCRGKGMHFGRNGNVSVFKSWPRILCGCMEIFGIVEGILVFSRFLQISTQVLNSNLIPKFTPNIIWMPNNILISQRFDYQDFNLLSVPNVLVTVYQKYIDSS